MPVETTPASAWAPPVDARVVELVAVLMAKTNVAGREARARIRLAKWLRDFPELAAAHARGELTTDHLEKIRRGLDNGHM